MMSVNSLVDWSLHYYYVCVQGDAADIGDEGESGTDGRQVCVCLFVCSFIII